MVERTSVRSHTLDRAAKGVEDPSEAANLLSEIRVGPSHFFDTLICKRLWSALTFVNERQSVGRFS